MTRNVLKPFGFIRVALAATVGFPVFIASNAFAQEPAAAPAPAGAQAEVERVIVTGSNIPTAEEVGPNPVDTYRRDDITRLGVRTTTDLIQKLPAATGQTFNNNQTNGGDGSSRVDLRGIAPKETLVLQDGRRLANVGFAGDSVDFNEFPLGLIDHIDILKDGASPIYGSDAVAGVINVFLIHRFRGLELYASYGNTNLGFANDMGQETGYLLAGTGDDKTDIVVYAGYFNEAAIFSHDVHLSRDADHAPFGGNDVRSGNFAGRVQGFQFSPKHNPLFDAGLKTPTAHAFANAANDPQYQPRSTTKAPPGGTPLTRESLFFNFADLTPEVAPTDRQFFYGSVIRDICDKYLTVFADFKYFRQFWDGGLAPAPFTPDVFTDATHPLGISSTLSVPIQNAFNPFTVPEYVSPGGFSTTFPNTQVSAAPPGTGFTTGVRYRGVEAGLRTDKITTDNYVFTGGLKGNMGEFGDYFKNWSWETGVRYNEDRRVERLGGIINNNALRVALLDTNPLTAFNPFGLNVNNKAVLNKVFVTTNHEGMTTLMTEDFKISGDMFNLPAGPVSFAIGVDHRTEHTSDNPDALTSSGQTTGAVNFAPTKGSRDVWSAFWEVRVPITSPTWNFPGLYSLELGYAERYDSFSDFGETERPKFDIRLQPIPGITLRAAYIEAFHAPALGELFSGTSQTFPNVTDTWSTKALPKLPLNPTGGTTGTEPQVEQHLLGNPTLKPETAYEWTYGGVITFDKIWSPLTGLTMSADWVHIDIRGFTTTLDPQFVINHETLFPTVVGSPGNPTSTFIQRGPPGSNGGTSASLGPILLINTPFQNLGRFITEALDYEAVYTLETSRFGHGDMGTLTATFNGTYLDDADLITVPNGKRTEVSGKFGGGFQGPTLGGNLTHNRWYSSLFYDGPQGSWLGGLDAGVTVHYVGQYWDTRGFEAASFKHGHFVPSNSPTVNRKIREWVTLDAIINYTFNFPAPVAQNEVAGYAKDGGKNVKMKDGKDKNVMPVSTAEYNPCGWRAWLNNTTLTLGVNNVTDEQPPFVAAAFENLFDEQTANALGRFWYIGVKKRF